MLTQFPDTSPINSNRHIFQQNKELFLCVLCVLCISISFSSCRRGPKISYYFSSKYSPKRKKTNVAPLPILKSEQASPKYQKVLTQRNPASNLLNPVDSLALDKSTSEVHLCLMPTLATSSSSSSFALSSSTFSSKMRISKRSFDLSFARWQHERTEEGRAEIYYIPTSRPSTEIN